VWQSEVEADLVFVDHLPRHLREAARFTDHGLVVMQGGVAVLNEVKQSDVDQFGAALRVQHGNLPLFLLWHSMGSFAAQAAILDHASTWAGVVLSGSTALDMLAAAMANAPADAPSGLESSTVKDLVAGSGLSLDDRGWREGVKQTRALPELWRRSGGHRTRPIALWAAGAGFALDA